MVVVQTCRKGVRVKVLVVCSGNHTNVAPFIVEQVNALNQLGIESKYFFIKGKGVLGYIGNLKEYYIEIRNFNPDVIHAHYGLSGLFANLQLNVPVVTTYHGSDINEKKNRFFSRFAMAFSRKNIFVSKKLFEIAGSPKRSEIIPCGVNMDLFKPLDKLVCRQKLGIDFKEKLVLFSGSFDNHVKNHPLARKIIDKIEGAKLIQLKGLSREEVVLWMNAVDCCLLTSFTEGSPQFIKEAMACNCPIVTVNVGDVDERLVGVDNSVVVESNQNKLFEALNYVFISTNRSNGREKLINDELSLTKIAERLMKFYSNLEK